MQKEHVRQAATPSPRQVDQARNAEYDSTNPFLRTSVEEKPIWISLFESLRDTLFPLRLPSLDPSSELPSTPIVTPDLLAGRNNPWAIGTATAMNAGLVAIFILLGLRSTISHLPRRPRQAIFRLRTSPCLRPQALDWRGAVAAAPISSWTPLPVTCPTVKKRRSFLRSLQCSRIQRLRSIHPSPCRSKSSFPITRYSP
jgi:hypothetical protein